MAVRLATGPFFSFDTDTMKSAPHIVHIEKNTTLCIILDGKRRKFSLNSEKLDVAKEYKPRPFSLF